MVRRSIRKNVDGYFDLSITYLDVCVNRLDEPIRQSGVWNVTRPQRLPAETRTTNVHQIPNARARKGIPLQPLSNEAEENRDSARPLPHGATDQNLVSKPADETQKGAESRQGDQRAGPAGEGRAGQDEQRENRQGAAAFGSQRPPPAPRPSQDDGEPGQVQRAGPSQSRRH